MSRLLQYQVLLEENATDLETEVDNLITEGWVPTGGVSMCVDALKAETVLYAQAMIYYKED